MRFRLNNDEIGCGYMAIINGENTISQESSDDSVLFNGMVEGLNVNLVSEKREDENYIEVAIDGVKYTTNQAGVNIVVYDTDLHRVMDNIAVNIENGNITRQ